MSYKILFADDSAMINEVMEFAFDAEGLISDFASTFAQVNSKINTNKYDLILIDLNLNAYNLVERIKKSDQNNSTEVFFLSKNNDLENKKKAKSLGVSGWIVKPFIPEKLVKTLRRHLDK